MKSHYALHKLFFFFLIVANLSSCTTEESDEPEKECTNPDFGEIISAVMEMDRETGGYIEITNVWGSSMSDLNFEWNTGDTGPLLNNIMPGVYTVTVTDSNGCTTTEEYDLTFEEQEGFQVGDTGPAGGIIFYVFSDGNALEAAPASSIWENRKWGCSGVEMSTSQELGSGPSNTATILNNCNENGIAARLCAQLEINGYDDWFLPSTDELDRLSYAVYEDNPQEYPSGFYWSSSEVISTMAYANYLPDGGGDMGTKATSLYVIAVRIATP